MSEHGHDINWKRESLDDEVAAETTERVARTPYLGRAIRTAGETVVEGGSITFFFPSYTMTSGEPESVIVTSANLLVGHIDRYSVEELEDFSASGNYPIIVVRNQIPENAPIEQLTTRPTGMKSGSANGIGFVHLEGFSEDPMVTFGCLLPEAGVTYSLSFPTQF